MQRWQALFDLSARQHGCVTVAQALRLGISRSTLTERVRREGWRRPYRGVLVVPGTSGDYRQDVAAAVLSAGPGAAAAGPTAAALWGLTPDRPRPVTVVVRDDRSLRLQPGRIVRRSTVLTAGDVVRFDDLPVTTPAWTPTDCARSWPDARLTGALVRADRLRLATVPAVMAVAERRGPFPGLARLRRVAAALCGELAHSSTERTARKLLTRAGVVLHPRPYAVLHRGRPIAEIDLAVPGVRYGAEIDGPHHLLPDQARADRARDRVLTRLGWTIDRFTIADVERTPVTFVRQVLASLEALSLRSYG
jgi:hypothetical protein